MHSCNRLVELREIILIQLPTAQFKSSYRCQNASERSNMYGQKYVHP